MIERCLIVDSETTGLDPKKDKLIEVGAVLYSVRWQTTLVQFSTLFSARENDASAINRISRESIRDIEPEWGINPLLDNMRLNADVFVAHRAEFDRQWLNSELWNSKPWVCTKDDFTWPQQNRPGDSLVQPGALARHRRELSSSSTH